MATWKDQNRIAPNDQICSFGYIGKVHTYTIQKQKVDAHIKYTLWFETESPSGAADIYFSTIQDAKTHADNL